MPEGWRNRRLEVAYGEARAVIEEQRQVIGDIDAKAMYTVRVVVVIVGVIVAAVRISGPEMFAAGYLTVGLGLMLVSLAFGVVTYSESSLFLGPNDTYLRQLVDADVDAETWEEDLCLRMSDWIAENDGDLRRNSWLLFLTQGSLLLGVAALVGAVAL